MVAASEYRFYGSSSAYLQYSVELQSMCWNFDLDLGHNLQVIL